MTEAKKRILVAVADAAARLLISRRLDVEGFHIETAEDGELALRALADAPPDLLVVDISLPKIDGIEVIRRVRTGSSVRNLPILVVSAHARDVVERGLGGVRGADGFFAKPIDYRELQAAVGAMLAPPPPVAIATRVGGGGPGRMAAFVGAKGGVGATTIAVNVAACLARKEQRTILFETARFHGTIGSLWGLSGAGSVDEFLADDAGPIRQADLGGVLRTHPSGMRVLLGSDGVKPNPRAERVMALNDGLRASADVVVVDVDSAVDSFGQVVLRTAAPVWIVVQPEPASVDRAVALISLLEGWGVDSRRIGVLVNQTSEAMIWEPTEVGQRIGRPVGCWIPCAAGAAFDASRRGLPLVEVARDHPTTNAIASLAATLAVRAPVYAR